MPIANLDGVVKYNNDYYPTDWTGGCLLKRSNSGDVTEIVMRLNQFRFR